MNNRSLSSGISELGQNRADWNMDLMAEQIFGDLHGAITRATIQEILDEVAREYSRARVQIFVPIFIRRETEKRLRAMQARLASENLEKGLARAREEDPAKSEPSSPPNALDEGHNAIGGDNAQLKPAA